eukprot:CAMPEP_0114549320 /NCGR_PEP_ID=MMETSP0114-20121206/5464_1 /TAXON_ID=31324 /ORGANISM="Goniomonas sp, Strain m" /LENGTH=437 /DNA_ID=CAMNT_0001733993 /DNA_START=24 /DNA_END=1337 /DNA_ORIENTATION=+
MAFSSNAASDSSDGELSDFLDDWLMEQLDDYAQRVRKGTHGGSVPGRLPNRARGRQACDAELTAAYFSGRNSVFSPAQFRRRFRMRLELFHDLEVALQEHEPFFTQRRDATGVVGFSCRQKICAVLRLLAQGGSADTIAEMYKMAESTLLQTLRKFCVAVLQVFGPEFLRGPNEEELCVLLEENASRGFPGCIGSLDCSHWDWKNCPKAWAGQFQGKSNTSTVVLEAVADKKLRFWHAFFGVAGSNNDLNVLDASPLFDRAMRGDAPAISVTINGNVYNRGYYLVDGIYPTWGVFVKPVSAPRDANECTFTKFHEAVRKDVERAFGVLQARWHIIAQPCRFWQQDDLQLVMMTCVVLHNMIVEDEHPLQLNQLDFDPPESRFSIRAAISHAPAAAVTMESMMDELEQIQSSAIHHALTHDLIIHVSQHAMAARGARH